MAERKRPMGPPIPGTPGVGGLVPFGLNQDKPRHFREAAAVAWENRDSWPYAWRILTQGVCDGCSLGPRGLADDVLPGLHVCMSRLKLLRNNTIGPLDLHQLDSVEALRRLNNDQLRALGRLPYPMVRQRGEAGFRRVSWDYALSLLGSKLAGTPPTRQAWFATSKGLTNETYYAFTKAARLAGTNNVDFCARLCHAASVSGLMKTIGYGAPTCSLSDLIGTDLLLLWGTNLANNQPVATKYLAEAKARGTRIVSLNPMLEKGLRAYWIPSKPLSALFGTRLVDDHFSVRAGGDLALMTAILQKLISWDALDHRFIQDHTQGWTALQAQVEAESRPDLLDRCGLTEGQVDWLAQLVARARTMVTVWSMGLTQHQHGTDNVVGVANLHLATGRIGRPLCGLMPIRGHSGVQGGGECGVSPTTFPGGVKVDAEGASRFSRLWGHPVPAWPGLSTGEMTEAAQRGELDWLYTVGGNLWATMPDPDHVVDAFERVAVRVHQDIHLNNSMLLEPGEWVVLLPAQTRYEQRGGGTSTNTERRIRFSPEIPGHPVIGEARPEWEIPGKVVASAFPDRALQVSFDSSQAVREEIAKVMPIYAGIENLREAGDWVQWGGPHLCRDGVFPHLPGQRACFGAMPLPDNRVPDGWYQVSNRRGKQFNSMIFSEEDAIQGGKTRQDIFMSEADAAREGLRAGDRVRLVNEHGQLEGQVRLADLRDRHLVAYWPEVNVLLPRRYDPVSKEPDYNTLARLERA